MSCRAWLAAVLCAGSFAGACAGDHCLNPQGDLPCNNVAGPGMTPGSGGAAPETGSAESGASAQIGGGSGVNAAGGAAAIDEGGLGGEGPPLIGVGGESGEAGASGHSAH